MRELFTKDARAVVTRAEDEARDAGSRTIEAEHLLLAAASAVDLDRGQIEDALATEWRAGLDGAGVDLVPPAPRRYAGRMRFGASAKQSLERAVHLAQTRGDKRIGPRHVAMGAVGGARGTVPRALKLAGVDTGHLWRD